MPTVVLHTALVPNRTNKIFGRNCQDAHAVSRSGEVVIGVVCDGCGSESYSEVGARLTSQFVASKCLDLASHLDSLPIVLYWQLVAFYQQLADLMSLDNYYQKKTFVLSHLLTTINGFVHTPQRTLLFSSGDGVRQVDSDVEIISQDNRPDYIAYYLVGIQPKPFETKIVSNISRIAVCSDAFSDKTNLLQNVWEIAHPDGLQRLINRYSKERMFDDDASIVTLEVER